MNNNIWLGNDFEGNDVDLDDVFPNGAARDWVNLRDLADGSFVTIVDPDIGLVDVAVSVLDNAERLSESCIKLRTIAIEQGVYSPR
jgi:hypothetical protein